MDMCKFFQALVNQMINVAFSLSQDTTVYIGDIFCRSLKSQVYEYVPVHMVR